ncbi:MAG: riboflavin kinase / adenylyltransferase [Methylobacteriaceae bacterium]|jgi:riboflavin kinase/FMN adenylyltransferase|nr:riboflavin kinase / adenylyltransferase [Methylobacteriaceae bacterium]
MDPLTPPPGLEGAVVAIGNFDGLHRGHAGVIVRALGLAKRLGRPCVLLTFEPHPADFFAGKRVIFRLTPREAKEAILDRMGLDGMIVLTFDAPLAGLSAEDFVREALVRRLAVGGVVAGYDFHFGAKRAGTPEFLKEAGARHGFAVEIVDKITYDASGSLDAVSSTAIREALESGDVRRARELLGHPFLIEGEVVRGAKRGRELGFPTANIVPDPSCRLKHGIYAVTMNVEGVTYGGVASFGRRPTFDDGPALLEIYLFDFVGDLYGKMAEVAFVDFIRGEEKFDSAQALVEQMNKDAARARDVLGSGKASIMPFRQDQHLRT